MQFDVHENPSPRMGEHYRFVVNIRSELLSFMSLRDQAQELIAGLDAVTR